MKLYLTQQKGKHVVKRKSQIPSKSWPNGCARSTSSCEALEIGPNELVVEISQLIAKGVLAMRSQCVHPQ